MFKKLVVVAVLMAAGSANAALNTGDIAFTAFNADEDGWALTTFVDIAANTKIYFSDNEWNGSAFNTGESFSSWTTGASTVLAGSVVRFSAIDKATASVSTGTYVRETVSGSTNAGISASGETIYAYLGGLTANATPTTFLTAISNATSITSAADGGLTNTGLVVGSTATQLAGSTDFSEYTGTRSGQTTLAGYKSLVANVNANWTSGGDGAFETTVPNTTAFTVIAAPVPEPESAAMLLAGLGLMGFMARRRQSV